MFAHLPPWETKGGGRLLVTILLLRRNEKNSSSKLFPESGCFGEIFEDQAKDRFHCRAVWIWNSNYSPIVREKMLASLRICGEDPTSFTLSHSSVFSFVSAFYWNVGLVIVRVVYYSCHHLLFWAVKIYWPLTCSDCWLIHQFFSWFHFHVLRTTEVRRKLFRKFHRTSQKFHALRITEVRKS